MHSYLYTTEENFFEEDVTEVTEMTEENEGDIGEALSPFFEVTEYNGMHLYMKRPVPSWSQQTV
jgi:hypothetical protein